MKEVKMRIEDKIKEIEDYLGQLLDILPKNFQEYIVNYEKKAACERYFEKIVEALVDLAFIVIKEKKFKIPEDDIKAFFVLVDENIIEEKLAEGLREAKGMRNIIVHEYGKINDELVFYAIAEELEKDVVEFLEKIKKLK
ncbi:MAG: DUF86 domain-containing protein [Nanoarchaeota archaeon]